MKYNNKDYYLVQATNITDVNVSSKSGDFSGVFLINGNKVIEVSSSVVKKDNKGDLIESPSVLTEIAGILDIDNDGEYELIIRSTFYEGSDSTLFKIIKDKAIQKRMCGCGV